MVQKMKILHPLHDQSVRSYCAIHGCNYEKREEYTVTKRSPRWEKISFIRHYLANPQRNKKLIWMDSDAIFVSTNTLPELSKDLALTYDFGYTNGGQNPFRKPRFSSGVMFIKCSIWSKSFWAKVWEHNDSGKGLSDQKSINYILNQLSAEEFEEHVEILDRKRFNAFPRTRNLVHYRKLCKSDNPPDGDSTEQTSILHFAGQYGGYCLSGTFYAANLLPILVNNMVMIDTLIDNKYFSKWIKDAKRLVGKNNFYMNTYEIKNIFVKLKEVFENIEPAQSLPSPGPNTEPTKTEKLTIPATVWSMDMHIATIKCVKSILKPMGVNFIDKSLSHDCGKTNTCGDLKVVNRNNAETAKKGLIEAFYKAYKSDKEFGTANIVMCFHPAAMCEFFIPFSTSKRIFVIASTRYEMGRWSAQRWEAWNKNLKLIAADGKNIIGANNHYDKDYIHFFTGIKPIYLPSHTTMDGIVYNPISDDIVVAKIHKGEFSNMNVAELELEMILKKVSSSFILLRKKYKRRYTYESLATNKAILHFPYQVSVMSLFEQYAMGIPILAPTPEFLWSS